MVIITEEIKRFKSSYTISNGCHLWQKHFDKYGYGIFYFRKKSRKAHRVAYYMTNGDIPKGMVIDHICRNRQCVNIEHLRCITAGQNAIENSRSVAAINKMKEFCKNGHKFDRVYGIKKKQRYCSICENQKSKRLQKKWLVEANKIAC